MPQTVNALATGLPGLDRMLQAVMPGDNIVWEIDYIRDYAPFAQPFLEAARAGGRKLVYFRFAGHDPLVPPDSGAEIHQLHPERGFEQCLTNMLGLIHRTGPKAFYLFDCISDLATIWYSDRMLANFFMIVAPALRKFNTLAYFGLIRNYHSWHATEGIHETASVLLEVYRKADNLYIHPLKVLHRHTPSMYALHEWKGREFIPVTSSATLSEILSKGASPWIDFTFHRFGIWTRTYMQARETLAALQSGRESQETAEAFKMKLIKMALTRDPRFLALAKKYFDLGDLVQIMKRMIGTGRIGGKSLGMLLARAILQRTDGERWTSRCEVHDSFLIGSDVFYTYLVTNKAWRLKRRNEDIDSIIARAEEAKQKVLRGVFPEYIREQFKEMLAYFGTAPIIVRSSSLLEDNFGNAFSGKYDSVFCANQGTPEQRLQDFMNAVRTVYASTMNRDAILYRIRRGLYEREEQMGLLVQRVSGEMHGDLFCPEVAGVGYSFNPYVWSRRIDPAAGVLRLVFGLGTRAVERTEDDYTRLVALNAPQRRPETDFGEIRRYAQKKVDVLDLKKNRLASLDWTEAAKTLPTSILEKVASCDEEALRRAPRADRRNLLFWTLTFDELLSRTEFTAHMRELLHTLQQAYGCPVDIEFTANLLDDGRYRINLLQCRPFQAASQNGATVEFPQTVAPADLILESHGPIIGRSRMTRIDRIIFVVPGEYSNMANDRRYALARIIAGITHKEDARPRKSIMLLGPGRWGTSMPQLGLPVTFADISPASVLCEIAVMHEGLIPDVSLGTHFLNDLVELDILSLAVFPDKAGDRLNLDFLNNAPNRLTAILPDAAEWERVVRVIDLADCTEGRCLRLCSDSVKQRAICHLAHQKNDPQTDNPAPSPDIMRKNARP